MAIKKQVLSLKRITVITAGMILLFFTACRDKQPSGPPIDDGPDSLALLRAAFSAPENCQPCHPNHFSEWQTSMHAYAFEDPVFFRLNEIGQERSGNALDQFCIKCHSPLGSMFGETEPGFDRAELSVLAQKGIQCDVCHLIKNFDRGHSITEFRTDRIRQGSIADPQANSFHDSQYDTRYATSAICSACHDIISPLSVRVEATSTEWDASLYSAMGLECQACHMPVYSGKAATDGPPREVHRHTFTGVDIPLIDFPGKAQTVGAVTKLLQNSVTLSLNAPAQVNTGENWQIAVTVSNDRTGHNIPSGSTFERQMWLEVRLLSADGAQVYFESGYLDDNGDLADHHSEQVANGELAADTQLKLYTGKALLNGEEIPFFWEADAVELNTIPAFSSDRTVYTMPVMQTNGWVALSVSLKFRAFPPHVLRAIGLPELVPEVPVFLMEAITTNIEVL